RVHAVAVGAGLVHDPREADRLTALHLGQPRKGDPHPDLQVVAYAFPVLQGAVLPPDSPGPLRDAAIGLHVALRDREDESIDVSHVHAPRDAWVGAPPGAGRV